MSDRIIHLEVDSMEARAIAAAREGAAFGIACEAFSNAEDASSMATTALLRWLGEGWLTGIG